MLIFCTPVTFMCDAVIADLALGVSHAVFLLKHRSQTVCRLCRRKKTVQALTCAKVSIYYDLHKQ